MSPTHGRSPPPPDTGVGDGRLGTLGALTWPSPCAADCVCDSGDGYGCGCGCGYASATLGTMDVDRASFRPLCACSVLSRLVLASSRVVDEDCGRHAWIHLGPMAWPSQTPNRAGHRHPVQLLRLRRLRPYHATGVHVIEMLCLCSVPCGCNQKRRGMWPMLARRRRVRGDGGDDTEDMTTSSRQCTAAHVHDHAPARRAACHRAAGTAACS
jgi:hypothetical protein